MNILLFEIDPVFLTSSNPSRYRGIISAFVTVVARLDKSTVWTLRNNQVVTANRDSRSPGVSMPKKFDLAVVHLTDIKTFREMSFNCSHIVTYGGGRGSDKDALPFHRPVDSRSPITEAEATQIVEWVASGASLGSLPPVLRPAAVSPADLRDLLSLLCSAYLIRGRELLQLLEKPVPDSCKTAAPFLNGSPSKGHEGSLSSKMGAVRIGCDYWDLDGMEASGEDRWKHRLCTDEVFNFSEAGIEAVSGIHQELTSAAPAAR